jgi:hypothetical protein
MANGIKRSIFNLDTCRIWVAWSVRLTGIRGRKKGFFYPCKIRLFKMDYFHLQNGLFSSSKQSILFFGFIGPLLNNVSKGFENLEGPAYVTSEIG